MDIHEFRLLFDLGLVVLIWIVQLVIYPSFKYYTLQNLNKWHALYTKRISYVVIPLMQGQLALGIWEILNKPSAYTFGSLFLILLVWFLTFIIFVPIHQKITEGFGTQEILHALVAKNWLRTVLWTLIFVWTLMLQIT